MVMLIKMGMGDNGPMSAGKFNCELGESLRKEDELERQALIIPKEPKSFNSAYCPNLNLDEEYRPICLLTEQPDQDGSGVKYEACKFSGKDYRTCPRMIVAEKMLEILSGI